MSDIRLIIDDSATAPAGETRAERIARLTREGGLQGRDVPPSYDDPDAVPPRDDWQSVQSENPFERLFLDVAQVGRITDAMVSRHGIVLAKFWEGKLAQVNSGATSSRRIKREMGDASVLARYAQQVRDDAEALRMPAQRTSIAAEQDEKKRERVEMPLRAHYYEFVRDDRTLSPDESEQLLALAEERGASRAWGAAFVLGELAQGGFEGRRGEQPNADIQDAVRLLLTTSWSDVGKDQPTPERVIGSALSVLMLNGRIAGEQLSALLADAEANGVDREAASEYVGERLELSRGGWRPPPGTKVSGNRLSTILESSAWLSPNAYEEEKRRLSEQTAEAGRRRERQTLRETAQEIAKMGHADPPLLQQLVTTIAHLDHDEAARVVREVLEAGGLRPVGSPSGVTEAERLISTTWQREDASPLSPSRDSRKKWPAVLALLLLGTVVAVWLLTRPPPVPPLPDPVAVVSSAGLNVRSEPTSLGGAATVLGEARRGDTFNVTGYVINPEGDRWVRVAYGGRTGWMSGEHVRFSDYGRVERLRYDDHARDYPDPARVYAPNEIDQVARGAVPEQRSPADGFGGEVTVRATLGVDGRVDEAACRTNAPPEACTQAERAVRATRFEPGRVAGSAVRSWVDVPVAFVREESASREAAPEPEPPRSAEAVSTPPALVSPPRLRVESEPGGFAGTVRVQVVVSRTAQVARATCEGSVRDAVCQQALRAVRSARFEAGQRGGVPAGGSITVPVRFTAPAPPACSDDKIARLVNEQLTKGQQCATLSGPAREQCLAELDTIKEELRACSN